MGPLWHGRYRLWAGDGVRNAGFAVILSVSGRLGVRTGKNRGGYALDGKRLGTGLNFQNDTVLLDLPDQWFAG